jgi:pyrroline-5-carboxylate reductase
MTDFSIAFIGGGNMARSLIGGLVADGMDPRRIRVADVDAHQLTRLREQFQVQTFAGNVEAARDADVVLLAVKPQVARSVVIELGPALEKSQPLVISIVAGLREADLERWLGFGAAIVRTMPNTPALVQAGATALHANVTVTDGQRETAETIMRAVGTTVWLEDEAHMDTVTALSGSGPAYFFLVMEHLERAATELGLPAETARMLTLQTAFGAAKMALESPEDAATLRRRVTSPGGTTEQALRVFEQHGLADIFKEAISAARQRGRDLAEQIGGS